MYRLMIPVLMILVAATATQAQQKKKATVVIDPDKAGPDWYTQGEYIGTAGKHKLGAEVIARGDGKFLVNILPGGLRGAGGNYKKRLEGTAQRQGSEVKVKFKKGNWTASIQDGVMKVTTKKGETFMLKWTIRKSKTLGKAPPKNALVLYGGPKDIKNWPRGHVVDGNLEAGDIDSKQKFKDHKIHLEFRLTFMPERTGQARSNSGVYVQHRYEIQVLDSFGLKGQNNECGGIYSQKAPKVNMCFPPLTWQTYDIEFKAARFDKSGKRISPAILTVRHNGVVIHDKLELKGPTPGGRQESTEPGPLFIQGHGGHVQYRNIWVVRQD